MSEALKAQHRVHSLFDSAVVLFDHIVEIAIRPHNECCREDSLGLELSHCNVRGRIPIQRDLLRYAALRDRSL